MATEVTYKQLEGDVALKLENLFGLKGGGLIEVNPGHVLVPHAYKDIAQRVIDLEIRPDDVWLISYPRTGSTWAQEMVWLIGNDLDFERAKELQSIRVPVLELTALLGNDQTGISDLIGETVSKVESMPSPRFIKSHLPRELLPRQLEIVKPKIVYICRNPKDMCVSYYHYCRLVHDMHGPLSDFCDLFLQDKVPMGPIWNHILGFWEIHNEPNVLFLRFEEMKKDLRSVIQRTAKFLGKELTEEGTVALLDYLSFASMKKNPAVNLEPILEFRKTSLQAKMPTEEITFLNAPDFIRKGNVGDFVNHMSPEMIKRFDDWTAKNLEGTNFTFDV
ncbi:hypothetical protein B566_EDAN007943 [Ephemera danica]|nr:hypothetical protein B566_EDAN007943 [Ephemera danica]